MINRAIRSNLVPLPYIRNCLFTGLGFVQSCPFSIGGFTSVSRTNNIPFFLTYVQGLLELDEHNKIQRNRKLLQHESEYLSVSPSVGSIMLLQYTQYYNAVTYFSSFTSCTTVPTPSFCQASKQTNLLLRGFLSLCCESFSQITNLSLIESKVLFCYFPFFFSGVVCTAA